MVSQVAATRCEQSDFTFYEGPSAMLTIDPALHHSILGFTIFLLAPLQYRNEIHALTRPESALAILQFAMLSDEAAERLARSSIYLYSARGLSLGVSVLK